MELISSSNVLKCDFFHGNNALLKGPIFIVFMYLPDQSMDIELVMSHKSYCLKIFMQEMFLICLIL